MPADVDTSLHASTSGAAAITAQLHSEPHALKLYGGWFCPFVQRAWITLLEKNVPHQYVEVNPYHKTPELLALNPRGLVPTLAVPVSETVGTLSTGEQGVADGSGDVAEGSAADGGEGREGEGAGGVKRKALYESAVICEYIDEAYASSGTIDAKFGPGLLPPLSDAYERARCRLWMDHVNSKIVPGFYRVLQHTPEKDSEYTLEEARAGLLGHIKTFVKEMDGYDEDGAGGSKGYEAGLEAGEQVGGADAPWFLGKEFSLVDVMLAPWAKRLFLIDHYKQPGGLGIPGAGEGGADEAVWARWRKWSAAISQRESVKDTWSEDGQYIEAYRRYAEDTTQSEVAQATRKRQRLP